MHVGTRQFLRMHEKFIRNCPEGLIIVNICVLCYRRCGNLSIMRHLLLTWAASLSKGAWTGERKPFNWETSALDMGCFSQWRSMDWRDWVASMVSFVSRRSVGWQLEQIAWQQLEALLVFLCRCDPLVWCHHIVLCFMTVCVLHHKFPTNGKHHHAVLLQSTISFLCSIHVQHASSFADDLGQTSCDCPSH